MSPRLADALGDARRRRFVGRSDELAMFRAAVSARVLPFHLLHVYGPGGIGKTTLLGQFARICEQLEVTIVKLDARNVESTPSAFTQAFALALGAETGPSPGEVLALRQGRQVLLIDTYEALLPLDSWLRETFLPELPEDSLVVLASRNPPATGWQTDAGWQELLKALPLRNLSPDESRAYLGRRGVPTAEQDAALGFTHGHPLALSLVADLFAQRPGVHFESASAPDVVKVLLEQLLQKLPGPAHRAALEVCALVRLTTEALLAGVLGLADAHDLFEWLRGLSFVEAGRAGLFPHDVVREALDADLRWRNPDWYAELHRRARAYYSTRLDQASARDQQRILFDYIYLHRHSPVLQPFFYSLEQGIESEDGLLLTDAVREDDASWLVAMVRKHEGEESARIAAHWLVRQSRHALAFKSSDGQPRGFVLTLSLHEASEEDLATDPGASSAWRYLRSHAPLRTGEAATMLRFWMDESTYQGISPVQGHILVSNVRHFLTTPNLAFTFLPCAYPEFWAPAMAYADLARLPEADFEVGGVRYGVFGHDWRKTPPLAWLALLAERETAESPQAASVAEQAEGLVVLAEDEFARAVGDALHELGRPDALRSSPLVRSRMVVERAGVAATLTERVATLQALLREAAETLQGSPRQARGYRALHQTYLHPAPTQERAAEALGLPFSTYRRHLKEGVGWLIEILWRWEVGGQAK